MKSCTIIISHYESLEFLHACIRQIRKYAHPEIEQTILIMDQSSNETLEKIIYQYLQTGDILIQCSEPLYSGYGIDFAIRNSKIKTDYICQLHVDAFPIHKNWLYVPIQLIEEFGFSFVGQHQFVCDGTQSIYPPDPFFAMSQCFNVARTETYREMSMEAGFTRFHNRPQSGLTFKNNDWSDWASHEYQSRGSDDDVVAFHWQDKYSPSDKLGLAISGMMNTAEEGGSFGRTICDLVFHFSSARESVGVMELMPQKYQHYYKKIQEGFSDELVQELLSLVKPNNYNRTLWIGNAKRVVGTPEYLNKRIEELKNA